jgi:hypothetical protein
MAETPVAFRTFAIDPPYAARTLRTQLQKQRPELIVQNGEGYAIDWSDYKRRVGVIEGLAIAIEHCDEMEKQERK